MSALSEKEWKTSIIELVTTADEMHEKFQFSEGEALDLYKAMKANYTVDIFENIGTMQKFFLGYLKPITLMLNKAYPKEREEWLKKNKNKGG